MRLLHLNSYTLPIQDTGGETRLIITMTHIDSQHWMLFRVSSEKVLKAIKQQQCQEAMQQLTQSLINGDPTFHRIFSHAPQRLEKKIIKTLTFLSHMKKLKKFERSIEAISTTHSMYAAQEDMQFHFFKDHLIAFSAQVLADEFSPSFQKAWSSVLDYIIEQLTKQATENPSQKMLDADFIHNIGGRETIERVHQQLYERLFNDPWLGQFFQTKDKATLIRKQTDFVLSSAEMHDNKGQEPPYTMHMHMFISPDMYDIRQHYLLLSMRENQLSETAIEHWLAYDNAFRQSIQKHTPDECVTRCPGQRPIVPKKPINYQPLD